MTEQERRKHERIMRKFIVSYRPVAERSATFDISQIKNISLGGMRFIASRYFELDAMLEIELQTPFIKELLTLQARVLESKEVVVDMIYDTRVIFPELNEEARHYLTKITEIFTKKNKESRGE
jgi:ribosome recycling factor